MGIATSVKKFFTPSKKKDPKNSKIVQSQKSTGNKSTSNGKNTGSIKSNVKPTTEIKKTVNTVNKKVVQPVVNTVTKPYVQKVKQAEQKATGGNKGGSTVNTKSTSGSRAQLSTDTRLQQVLEQNKLKREHGNKNSIDYTGGVGNQYITATRGGQKYNFKTDLATAKQRDQVIGTTGRLAQNLAFNNPVTNAPLQAFAGAYGGMQNARKQGTNALAGGLKGAGSALGNYGKNLVTKDGLKYDSEIEAIMTARGKDPNGARDKYDIALGLGAGLLSPSITDLKKAGNVASNGISALTRGKLDLTDALQMGAVANRKLVPATKSMGVDPKDVDTLLNSKQAIKKAKTVKDSTATATKLGKEDFMQRMLEAQRAKQAVSADIASTGAKSAKASKETKALISSELAQRADDLAGMTPAMRQQAIGEIVAKHVDDPAELKRLTDGYTSSANKKFGQTATEAVAKQVDEVPALVKQVDEVPAAAPVKKKRGRKPKDKTTPSPAELKQQIVASQPPAVTPQKFNPASLGNEASINDYLRYGRQMPNIDLAQLMKQAPTSPSGGMQLLQGATRNSDDIMAGFRKSSTPPVIDLKQADNLGAGTFRQVDDVAGQGATLGAKQADNAVPPRVDMNLFSGAGKQADDVAGQGATLGAKQADDMAGAGKQADDMAGAKADPFKPKSAEDIASEFGADDMDDVVEKKKRGLLGKMAVGTMVGVPVATGLAAAWQRMNGGNSGYTEPAEEVAEEVASSSGSGRAGGSGGAGAGAGAGAGYGGGAGMLDPNMQDTGGYGTPYSEAEYQAYLANQDAYKQMVAQAMGQPSMANDIMAMLGQPSGAVLGDYSDLMAQLGINPNIPVGQLGQQLQASGITMMPDNFMDYEQWASGFEQARQALDSGQTDLQGALSFMQAQMQPQFDQAVKELNTQYEARLNALKEDLASRGLLNSGIYDQAVLLLNQDLSASLVALNAEHNANVLQMSMQYWGDSQDRAMQLHQMYMQEKQIAIENYYKQMQMQAEIGQINTENMQKAKDRQYEVALTLLQSELEKQAIMLKYGMDGMNMGNEQYLKGLNKQIPNVYNTNKNTNVNMNYN